MAPPLKKVIGFWLLVPGLFIYLAYRLPGDTGRLCYAQTGRNVRVLIFRDLGSLSLKVNGQYETFDAATDKIIGRGKNLHTTVTVYGGGILLGNTRCNTHKLLIRTDPSRSITINGRELRGDIKLIKDNNKLLVVNFIGLEDYVKGVSIRETSHYWPFESLKAQVIVFRTFALYKMQESGGKDFDLTSDVYSQVYGGVAAERFRINKAVDQTQGLALVYKGKILPAFYHATCAGHTAASSTVWNIDIEPLKGVSCPFCAESPHFKWHAVMNLAEAAKTLTKAGHKISGIKEISILGRDHSGRVTDLKIKGDKKEMKILAKDFRNILGPNIVKSTNFELKTANGDMILEGFGWGHGIGLCQWGAYFMAKLGKTYKQILEYYYPGSGISRI